MPHSGGWDSSQGVAKREAKGEVLLDGGGGGQLISMPRVSARPRDQRERAHGHGPAKETGHIYLVVVIMTQFESGHCAGGVRTAT